MLRNTFEKEQCLMRDTYCNTLMELASDNDSIVALDADLVGSSGMKPFWKKFPERFFNCGIAEANMIGIAAGLSATGKIPFAHSFGTFATRRTCDQVFQSCAYAKLNVRIVGSDPGVTAALNGGTHMPFEDMAVLRAIPEITLIEPADSVQLRSVLIQLADAYGVYYIRMMRKNPVGIFAEGTPFRIGRGVVLQPGFDVTLVASGILLHEAMKAANTLSEMGISVRVVNIFTWKPIDKELLTQCAEETGAIVTCENHNIIGGLGSAVCEAVCETVPVPVERVGACDRFGEVGTEDYLRQAFGMTSADIVEAAKRAIAKKKKYKPA